MRLVQLRLPDGDRALAVTSAQGRTHRVAGVDSTYALAQRAIETGQSLVALIQSLPRGAELDLAAALAEARLLSPIDHADPSRVWLTGTGLTHLGSADARDRMHTKASEEASDSLKMFRMGLAGGKPLGPEPGIQPEWFYKGDGRSLVAPESALMSPAFALDGGEEPEVAGIYLIAPDGTPCRVGFALANEFSDHVMERMNYLYLAHSKLRPAAIGPELLLGELPAHVVGTARIMRGGQTVWERDFLTGEDNMSHWIRNLEHHHFKYELFRRPGDIHVHFLGTATLSFANAIQTRDGDRFEIAADAFGLPLRNTLRTAASPRSAAIRQL